MLLLFLKRAFNKTVWLKFQLLIKEQQQQQQQREKRKEKKVSVDEIWFCENKLVVVSQ